MTRKITFLSLLFAHLLINAQSVGDTVRTAELDELVMVSARQPTKISDIPGTVWVMNQKEIEVQLQNGANVKDMLGQLIPSMDIGSQGRSNFGQNMRGRAAFIMIDGVSLNSLRTVIRQLDAIDPFNIAKIEVLSGASALYGGNATGGIINIVTKTPKENGFNAETQLGGTSGFRSKEDRTWRAAQSIAYKKDKFSGRLGIAYQQNGGFYDADGDQVFADIAQTDLQYNKSIDVLEGILQGDMSLIHD